METIRTVLYAVLIAVGVRTFLYEPFNIPSGSMLPTLLVGDYLFVSKFSYGYSRYTFPFGPDLFEGRIWNTPPKRGDVVVFKLPRDPSTDYIKRIVGLPGDRIQVIGGILNINGQPVTRKPTKSYVMGSCGYRTTAGAQYIYFFPEEFARGRPYCANQGWAWDEEQVQEYLETLPNGVVHRIIERGDDYPLDNTKEFVVPPAHYFAMGDNRDNSADSRADVGYIPEENLVGRAEFLFFSTDGTARWWEVWRWPVATRYARLLNGVR